MGRTAAVRGAGVAVLLAVLPAVLLGLLLAGCSRPGSVAPELTKTAPAPTDTLPAGTCPTKDDDTPNQIDWADFVHVAGRMYVRAEAARVPSAQVGAPLGTVRCTFSEQTSNPWLVPRDGDASFLKAGTELRAVVGRPVAEVVAASAGGGSWQLYRVQND